MNIMEEIYKLKKIFIIASALSGCLIPVAAFIVIAGGAVAAYQSIDESSEEIAATTSSECGFTISDTSLTKEEYITAIKDYSKKKSISSDFVERAGDIYDLAKNKNLNPEMVIVRAISEGGINSTTGTHNHWGIGCTNTGGIRACKSYSSFMDGVEGFLNNISRYDSLTSMMSKYAYIGKYWYNPGSAGKGGCYYAKYIFPDGIPSRVQTACSDKHKNCSDSKCIKTIDSDQQAYAEWQVSQMAKHRKDVFGLEQDEGVSCNTNTETDEEADTTTETEE